MIDLGQLLSDTSGLVALLSLPFLAFGAIFLLAYDRELGGDLFGFGKRTFLLLTMAGVIGWVANVPIFVWNHSIMAVNIGGALLPVAISIAALESRILPGRVREVAAVLFGLALAIMALLAVILFLPSALGSTVVSSSLPFLLAFGGAIVVALVLRRELSHHHLTGSASSAVSVLGLIALGTWGTYLSTQVVIGLGIESQFPAYLVVPLVVGAVSVPLRWPQRDGPALAYATATLGVLLGADVLHQPGLFVGPAFLGAIGGAGPEDLVFLSGPFALAVALGIDVAMRAAMHSTPTAPVVPAPAAAPPANDPRFMGALSDYAAKNYVDVPSKVFAVVDASIEDTRTGLGLPASRPGAPSLDGLSAHPLFSSDLANLRALASRGAGSRDDARRALVTGFLLQRGLLDLLGRRFANLRERVAAFGVDLLLTFVPAVPLLALVLVAGHFFSQTAAGDSVSYNGAIAALGAWPYLFFVATEAVWGATPGKRLLGLKVVGPHGESPPLLALFARNLPKVLPLFALSLTVGVAMIYAIVPPVSSLSVEAGLLLTGAGIAAVLFIGVFSVWAIRSSPYRQRIGDSMAGTMVWKRDVPLTVSLGMPGVLGSPSAPSVWSSP